MLIPRLAAGVSQAMQIGNEKFDMDSMHVIVQQAFDTVLNGLPYIRAEVGEKSAVERDREALIKRAIDRRDRLMKGRDDVKATPEIKPLPAG
jgi:hypothetical protein